MLTFVSAMDEASILFEVNTNFQTHYNTNLPQNN